MKPILFSTPMVQAILAGRKTQTRRVVKPQPPEKFSNFGSAIAFITDKTLNHTVHCPYGNVGDVLWVRESFSRLLTGELIYKANAESKYDKPALGWKPSIHMPFTACRLFLKIKSIRVERLQAITMADATAEGIEPVNMSFSQIIQSGQLYRDYSSKDKNFLHDALGPQISFETLWKEINGNESWDANPWVWVIEFERIEKPQ